MNRHLPDLFKFFFCLLLLPAFIAYHFCSLPFSSDHLGPGILGPGLHFIRLIGFVQRRARRQCLRGACMLVRAPQTTQVSGWSYHVRRRWCNLF